MGGLARPDLSFDPRVVRRSEPDPDSVTLLDGSKVPVLRSPVWYHVPEIGWDRPVMAYDESCVPPNPESEGVDNEKKVFDSSSLSCRDAMVVEISSSSASSRESGSESRDTTSLSLSQDRGEGYSQGTPGPSGRTFGVDLPEEEDEALVFERREGQFSAKVWTSRVTEKYIQGLREEFEIADGIILSAPLEHERADQPPVGKIAFNRAILNVIGGLPMHPLISQFVSDLGCSPTQLVPNVYKIFVGMAVLWAKIYDRPVTLQDFSQYYSFKSAPGQHGYYYARANDDHSKVVTRLPTSQKNWKDHFFWVEGNASYERCPIRASFSELGVILVQNSCLII